MEAVCIDACQELLLNHLASEIITSHAFEQIVGRGLNMVINKVMDCAIEPKQFGVCKEYFVCAINRNVRYVYGGPKIVAGWIVCEGNTKLFLSKGDNGYDPVNAAVNSYVLFILMTEETFAGRGAETHWTETDSSSNILSRIC